MTKKKKQQKDLTEQELIDSMNNWAKKMFSIKKK